MYVYGTNYDTNYFNNTTYEEKEEEEEVCSAIRYDINIMVCRTIPNKRSIN